MDNIIQILQNGISRGFGNLTTPPTRGGNMATLSGSGDRFVLQAADGRSWTATRSRDLRRRARQHGLTISQ